MRQRISEAVSSADVRFLRNQRMKLRKARISTISSFCFSLLRENIDLVTDISAGFSLIDETRSTALKEDILSDVLEDFYANGDKADRDVIVENYVARMTAVCVILYLLFTKRQSTIPSRKSGSTARMTLR